MPKRFGYLDAAWLIAIAALVGAACFDHLTITQDQDQNHHNTQPSPAPSPQPSVSPSPGSSVIESMKVSIVGGDGSKTVKVGEKFVLTATPHDKSGVDPCKFLTPCPYYGQADIRWSPITGDVVQDLGSPTLTNGVENYNRDLKALKVGSFSAEAVLFGRITGRIDGTVVP